MAYWPEAVETEARVCPRRRRTPRMALWSLTYVRLDDGNGGIIRDLTESGMAIQAAGRLQVGQELELRCELVSPRVRVDVRGRVAWADWSGQAGIQFLGLTSRTQRSLRDWLLVQMLASAAASGRSSMFAETELAFSAPTRTAIVVKQESPRAAVGGFLVSARGLRIFVDACILAGSLWVFAITARAGIGASPGWVLTTAVAAAMVIFTGVYRVMFWVLATPGQRMARAAMLRREERVQRFR